jgi:hypothetical protein
VLQGDTVDREIMIQGFGVEMLSDIAWVTGPNTNFAMLNNGERVDGGAITPRSAVFPLEIDGTTVLVNARGAQRVEIGPVPDPEAIAYTVTVKSGNGTVSQKRGAIALNKDGPGILQPNRSTIAPARLMEPAPITNSMSVPLPAQITDVVVAGGGRYLLLQLASARQVAVFDASAAKIIAYLPLPYEEAKIVAGMEKLIVWLPPARVFQRWNLETLEREVTEDMGTLEVLDMAIGSASNGPLVVLSPEGTQIYDVQTLKRIDPAPPRQNKPTGDPLRRSTVDYVRASADGGKFIIRGEKPSVIDVSGGSLTPVPLGIDARFPWLLSSDGHLIFGEAGVYTTSGPEAPEQFKALRCAPAAGPGYFLCFTREERPLPQTTLRAGGRGQPTTRPTQSISVYTTADRRGLFSIKDLDEMELIPNPGDYNFSGDRRFPIEKRAFLIPDAELLVTVNAARTGLFLRKVNVQAEMAKAGADYYLYVEGEPPQVVTRGGSMRYPIIVKSSAGGVTFKLEAGPPGMSVSTDGVLTWRAPATGMEFASVIVSIQDSLGKLTYHAFVLAVR